MYPDEIAKTMQKLLRLDALYLFSDEDMAKLYQWTSLGCDLNKLLDVYEFAQDTDQPDNWDYAKQIYDKAIEIKIHGKTGSRAPSGISEAGAENVMTADGTEKSRAQYTYYGEGQIKSERIYEGSKLLSQKTYEYQPAY